MHVRQSRLGLGRLGLLAAAVLFWTPRPAEAYVDGGPATLGGLCVMSSHIMAVKIENSVRRIASSFIAKLRT